MYNPDNEDMRQPPPAPPPFWPVEMQAQAVQAQKRQRKKAKPARKKQESNLAGCLALFVIVIVAGVLLYRPPPVSSPTRQSAAPVRTSVPVRANTAAPAQSRPTAAVRATSYTVTGNANMRSCAGTTCAVAGTLAAGELIQIIGTTEGSSVGGSTRWLIVLRRDGTQAYIHSSLAREGVHSIAPVATQGGSTTQQVPRNCDEAVAMGLTAQEAAQWSHLDRDNDGVACYGD